MFKKNKIAYHAHVARLEFDEVGDFARCDVDLNAVLSFDQGIRVPIRTEEGIV